MTKIVPFLMLALLATACKTTADANMGVAVPEPTTREPQMRVTENAERPEPIRNSERDLSEFALTAETAPRITDEEMEEEFRRMGRTQQELRQMGITPDMTPEQRAEAEARFEEQKKPLPANPTAEQVIAKADLAVLRTTPCEEGDCPVYQLRILNDYTLHYQGIENVDLIGHYHGQPTTFNPMTGLLRLWNLHRYSRMEDTYPKELNDQIREESATITEIEALGRRHSVVHYFDGPDGLEEIETYLFDLLENADWTELLVEAEE
ncbi:MAG: DUF6438 domain-containing protein [Bacteroidota bacterium]